MTGPQALELEGTLGDEAMTARLAVALAPLLRQRDIVALYGELGAGKTAFARALIRTLAGGAIVVPSPTFTLVQCYETPLFPIWHFDLWRLDDPEDAFELGIHDAFETGLTLLEWPDRLGASLPARCFGVHLDIAPALGAHERHCALKGFPESRFRILTEFFS